MCVPLESIALNRSEFSDGALFLVFYTENLLLFTGMRDLKKNVRKFPIPAPLHKTNHGLLKYRKQ